jgi:hypothetical protein
MLRDLVREVLTSTSDLSGSIHISPPAKLVFAALSRAVSLSRAAGVWRGPAQQSPNFRVRDS